MVHAARLRFAPRWQAFEAWIGSRSSGVALLLAAVAAFAAQSVVLPVHPGRDLGRYLQTYVQLGYDAPVLPSVLNTRGPLAAVGVGLPLELGGFVVEAWMALLYSASILAWAVIASWFGPRAALAVAGLLLVYPGYAILFHGFSGDALFAAAFAGWALVVGRALLGPSAATFLVAGLATGTLVLVRPPNQMLLVVALVPLVLAGTWLQRARWAASFFVAAVVVGEGWKAIAAYLWEDAVALRPSLPVAGLALLLVPLLVPGWGLRRAAAVIVPVLLAVVVVAALRVTDPVARATSAVDPPLNVFLFRAYVLDGIVRPENGPASRELAATAQRELIAHEPYRSYDVDLEEFFTSGSERIFEDIESLSGHVDLEAVTREAIERHPQAFAAGIAKTFWNLLWSARMYAAEEGGAAADENAASAGSALPQPTGGEPIPASRVGPSVWTLGGGAREVWRSATEHPLVFDDPADARRYAAFERDTARLSERMPARQRRSGLVHRLNQASRAFPPPLVWIVVGAAALALRRPRRMRVVVVLAAAATFVVAVTSLVARPVPEYAAPVSGAFLLLAAVGLFGVPARRLGLPWRREPTGPSSPA
jgi:hypothetical protein